MANDQDTSALIPAISALVEELLAPTPDLFMVGVVVRGRLGATRKVDVLVDGDNGVGIDNIVELSRALGDKLEEQDLIKGAYNLEVGSPGIDHPLQSPRQYQKNVGRGLLVDTADGRQINGTLTAATDTELTVAPEPAKKLKRGEEPPAPVTLPFAEVKKAVVQVRF